jgi:hypothetical protein
LERIEKTDKLNASAPATHIGDGLKEVLADSATLPIGAVVLMSDGADNSGGIDLDTISEIKRQRIPIHTVGFGRERMAHDIELTDVQMPARSLAKSRLEAQVTFHQWGLKGEKARLVVRDSGKVLTSRDIVLAGGRRGADRDGAVQRRGCRSEEPAILHRPLPEEENKNNNALTRVLYVDNAKPRILYMEGEPRWDYKFLRRAVEDDKNIDLYTIVRTTQNKIYTPGAGYAPELKDGFPTKVDDLFDFQGIILGSVEANYFTTAQQDLIQQFVDRRGGGLLFLGGRTRSPTAATRRRRFADLLPVRLPIARTRSSRSGHGGTDAGRPRQPDHAHRRQSRCQRGALEEAAVPDEFSGGRAAQAGRAGAGGNEGRAQAAAVDHTKIRTRTHGRVRHRRRLALADAAAGAGHEPRAVLAAVAALAGERHAHARGHLHAAPGAVR